MPFLLLLSAFFLPLELCVAGTQRRKEESVSADYADFRRLKPSHDAGNRGRTPVWTRSSIVDNQFHGSRATIPDREIREKWTSMAARHERPATSAERRSPLPLPFINNQSSIINRRRSSTRPPAVVNPSIQTQLWQFLPREYPTPSIPPEGKGGACVRRLRRFPQIETEARRREPRPNAVRTRSSIINHP